MLCYSTNVFGVTFQKYSNTIFNGVCNFVKTKKCFGHDKYLSSSPNLMEANLAVHVKAYVEIRIFQIDDE